MIYKDMVRAGELYTPCAGTLPAGFLTQDNTASTQTSYTNQASYTWRDVPVKLNMQGQHWEQDRRVVLLTTQTYNGCRQVSTPRAYTSAAYGLTNESYQHIVEFEFLFTGSRLTIVFYNSGGDGSAGKPGGEIKVWIERNGRMYRAKEDPVVITNSDGNARFRNINFAAPYHGRIRVEFGASAFHSIRTDGTSIIAPAPDRIFGLADGDSYFESAQALAANSTTGFFTSGIIDFLFEKTGFVWGRRGQGSTGFNANGIGLVHDDTEGVLTQNYFGFVSVTIRGVSRTMSQSRRDWMTNSAGVKAALGKPAFINTDGEDFGQPLGKRPLIYLLNGTWNDASAGGVTDQEMHDRAQWCYNWVNQTDPFCTFVHVSPEPFDDTLFGNNVGPPRVGDKSYVHVQAQQRAATTSPRVNYINAFGPDERWWTGYGPAGPQPGPKGTEGVPTNSQQAQLVSTEDGIHGTKRMNEYFAAKIAEKMADVLVPLARVNGLV